MGHWIADWLVEKQGLDREKVYAVGAGVNVDVNKVDYSRKTGRRILFVGRDFERKNGPLVLEAFRVLRTRMADAELYIAGPRGIGSTNDNVLYLGDLSRDDLSEVFNLCDVFCMPSKFEAYGMVFPEALCYGLPCIGRDAFEIPYFIEDGKTGLLLRDEDSFELASLMERCLRDRSM